MQIMAIVTDVMARKSEKVARPRVGAGKVVTKFYKGRNGISTTRLT